tara:strand:- start:24 stop:305 length:282 start_codon:yes stop_codon:yes gene_type:complete
MANRSIGYKDQDFGGSFNPHKNWKKLREKHRRRKELGTSGPPVPETYTPNSSAGKGDMARYMDVSEEEYNLRWDLAFGRITLEDFNSKLEDLK